MNTEKFDIAVIGGGAAGTMAYLRAVLNNDKCIFFLGDAKTKKKARATWVSEIDNMPGVHGVKNPISRHLRDTLKWVKEQSFLPQTSQVIRNKASSIHQNSKGFEISYSDKKQGELKVRADYVIFATGIMDMQPHIQGSIEPIYPYANRNDVLYCIRCDGHRVHGHVLSIIGHKDPAIYIGAILKERYHNKQVYILTNGEPANFSEAALKLAKAYAFQIENAPILEVRGKPKEDGLHGFVLENESFVPSTRSVVALGIIAYSDILADLGLALTEDGRVKTSNKFESEIPNLFVVGDLVSGPKMQVYTAWDEAVDAADEINKRIRSQKREAALSKI